MKIEKIKIVDELGEIRDLTPYEGLTRCILIEWTLNGAIYKFEAQKSKDQMFIPVLSRSREEIVLFLMNYSEYSPPCNVIILNKDAKLRHQICPPKLISDEYKKYQFKVGEEKASQSRYFIQPDIYESASGDTMYIWIGFNYDWYEIREIDLKTGEFGKCLRCARL